MDGAVETEMALAQEASGTTSPHGHLNATCRICGASGDFPLWHAREMLHGMGDTFDYFECPECGCVQIADIPADLSRFYPGDYFSFRGQHALARNPVRRLIDPRRVKRQFGEPDALGAIAEAVSRPFDYVRWVKDAGLGPDARVLDIGCGAGKTLVNMALGGFPGPTGVDPFVDETLRYACGVTIHKAELADFARDHAGGFDFIMLRHSLEHMLDPLAALTHVEALLAPGGRVLVVIPVADSWAWRHYRQDWFALDPPRHIHLLTTPAMEILAGKAGLKILHRRQEGKLSQFTGSERVKR
jgi:SAM-dependent methyltransferase